MPGVEQAHMRHTLWGQPEHFERDSATHRMARYRELFGCIGQKLLSHLHQAVSLAVIDDMTACKRRQA